jgi:hypothetical protein
MHPREVTDVLLKIVRGRRWLNELVDDARASASIAKFRTRRQSHICEMPRYRAVLSD